MDSLAIAKRRARAEHETIRAETTSGRAKASSRFTAAAIGATLGFCAVAYAMFDVADVKNAVRTAALGTVKREIERRVTKERRAGVLPGLGGQKAFARDAPAMRTPIFMISVGTTGDDAHMKMSLEKLRDRSGLTPEEIASLVTVSPGVDATAWPNNANLADFAVKDVRKMAKENGKTLMELPWLQILDLAKQQPDGKLPTEWRRLSHHVGCLYAHLFQWQLIKEKGLKKAMIVESDGVGASDLPFVELQRAIDRMPADADVLFTSFGNFHGGDLIDQWNGHGDDGTPVPVHLYKWDQFTPVAGLQAYVITDSFVRKVQEFMSHKGADMVDAWLIGKMCVVGKDKDWNMRGLGETQFMPPGSKPILNCYHATTWS